MRVDHTQGHFPIYTLHPALTTDTTDLEEDLLCARKTFYELGTIIIYLTDEETEAQKSQMTSQVHIDRETVERAFKLSSISLESLCPSHDNVVLSLHFWGCVCLYGGLDSQDPEDNHGRHKMDHCPEVVYAPSRVALLATSPAESSADEVGGW